MPKHVTRANAAKSKVRVQVEHVFARQKEPMALTVRTIGLARAKGEIGLVEHRLQYAQRSGPEADPPRHIPGMATGARQGLAEPVTHTNRSIRSPRPLRPQSRHGQSGSCRCPTDSSGRCRSRAKAHLRFQRSPPLRRCWTIAVARPVGSATNVEAGRPEWHMGKEVRAQEPSGCSAAPIDGNLHPCRRVARAG